MASRRNGTQLLTLQAAKLQVTGRTSTRNVAAIVTNCTRKKSRKPGTRATPVSLTVATQSRVETEWLRRLTMLEPEVAASALYTGRGFGIALRAANLAAAPIFIASAGLGLVEGDALAPAYGLTLTGKHKDAVSARVEGAFSPNAWFEAMLSGPFSSGWTDAFGEGDGEVLIALTKPYAEMIGRSLAALAPSKRAKLRLFGVSLTVALPEILRPAIAPYDRRLDTIMPGLDAHFSNRALLHFVQSGFPAQIGERAAEFEAVEAALGAVQRPHRPRRPTRTDAELVAWIAGRLRSERGIAKLLGVLRHDEGVACEQARFTRLYRAALEQRAAA
jgi:hypothetical protein